MFCKRTVTQIFQDLPPQGWVCERERNGMGQRIRCGGVAWLNAREICRRRCGIHERTQGGRSRCCSYIISAAGEKECEN